MFFEKLANYIETNKQEISHEIALETLARQLTSYKNFAAAELATKFLPTVEMVVRYLRSGNPQEYRDYTQNLTITRLSQGYTAEDFYMMAEILVTILKRAIAKELTAPDQLKELERYQRRLDGIQSLAQSTIVATRAAFSKNKVSF
jgi:hypothetical protein